MRSALIAKFWCARQGGGRALHLEAQWVEATAQQAQVVFTETFGRVADRSDEPGAQVRPPPTQSHSCSRTGSYNNPLTVKSRR